MIERHEKIIFSVSFFYANNDIPYEDIRQEVLISLFKGYRHFGKNARKPLGYTRCVSTLACSLYEDSPLR